MAISVSGRIVKCRPKSDLKRLDTKKKMAAIVEMYNHLRIQFSDSSERHFLFTDKQINKAIEEAKSLTEDFKTSWVKELWYEDTMDTGLGDIKKDIELNQLPLIAKKVNHIRVNLGDRDIHLLLSDSAVRSALTRASRIGENLPKVSWLSDVFEEKSKWAHMEKSELGTASKSEELLIKRS